MKSELLIRFGVKVRKQRNALDLSQEDLAGRAHVHRTYIGMIERGEKNITLTNIKKLGDALGLKLEEIMKL